MRSAALLAIMLLIACAPVQAADRIAEIKKRGHLTCGIVARVRGFTDVAPDGRTSGFEPDLCRAVAAAVLGPDAKVTYETADHMDRFRATGTPDVVARRLTVTLRRELEPGLAFSPVIFFDGTSLLVRKAGGITSPASLSGRKICVRAQSEADAGLDAYFAAHAFKYEGIRRADLAAANDAFLRGDCDALAADLSELAPIRADSADKVAILPEILSKEPLALLTHAEDTQFTAVVRWTMNALLAAEELNITAARAKMPGTVTDPETRRLLGLDAGNGAALGLRETWAADAIATVGNYGEIFARNLGDASAVKLPRGPNALWRDGGLLYALPLR